MTDGAIEFDGCHCLRSSWSFGESYGMSHYMAAAIIGEFARVVAWHARHDPDTGREHSWLQAMESTADNPPTFDRMWDEAFEGGPVLVALP